MPGKERIKYFFVAPGIIWILVFTIFPLLYSLRLCFFHARLGKAQRFIGLKNFGRVFSDYRFWSALQVTLFFVATSGGAKRMTFSWVSLHSTPRSISASQ